MKIRYSLSLLLALPLVLASCLKDQEDVFSQSASERVQAQLNKAQQTLTSGEYGWVMDVYPESSQSYGGFPFTFQFTDSAVTVGSTLSVGTEITSLYRMATDGGATLSFDSYNQLLHYFSTPTGDEGMYEAFKGDFEFIIDSVGADVVKVHAKRSLNTLYFRRLNEPAADYIKKTADMESNFVLAGAEGTIGSEAVQVSVDVQSLQLTFVSANGEKEKVAFAFAPEGLHFYRAVTVNGKTFSSLNFDPTTSVLTGTATDGSTVTLQGKRPEGYVSYDTYAGTYWFKYSRTSVIKDSCRVTLTPNEDKTAYLMQGLNPTYNIVLKYNKGTGTLEMNSQILGQYQGNNVWLAAWGLDTADGNLTWAPAAGMVTTWNGDEEHPVYTFGPNSYGGLVADSFIMWQTDTSNKSLGQFTGAPAWQVVGVTGRTYRLYFLKNLTKITE